MKNFRRGTPAFGLFLGALLVLAGALVMWIGFWKTLVLVLLFAIGYFIGAVGDKPEFVRGTVNKVVPKKQETINFRSEVEKEQSAAYAQDNGEVEPKDPSDGEE